MMQTQRRNSTGGFRAAVAAALFAATMVVMPVLGMAPAGATTGDLVITGVIDGPLPGGLPKAVELYAVNNIADLSDYGLGSANNGGGTDGEEFTFPATSAPAGDFIYVASEATGFLSFFGFAADYTDSAVNINGDDAIELFMGGEVADVFGDINVDGTGEPWEHLDGWTYRVDGTGQDGSTFTLDNWTFSGPNALDGETTNAAAAVPFPAGTYSAAASADLTIDCSSTLVTDAGVAASTTITASDADDTVVAMTLEGDNVSPGGNLLAGTFAASAGVGDPATLELNLDSLADGGFYTATIEAENSAGDTITCDLAIQVIVVVKIHEVQGSGTTSPLVGTTVAIEGIVVGDFQDGAAGTNGDLNGFHVQEEDIDADANLLTSEGIFVFNGSNPTVDVAIGDLVRVEGSVSEFKSPASDPLSLTEISSFTGVTVLSSGNPLPTPATLSLPVTSVNDFEFTEGMAVTFPQGLVISEYFNFDRFGEIVLTSERHLTPTAEVEPGLAAVQAAQEFLLDRITLDDGRTSQNPDPAIHPNGSVFDLGNLFRGGDTVANVTGVMDYSFGLYRIQPTQGADYSSVNPRTASPDAVGGRLQVATFNVLNYFTTLDYPFGDPLDNKCGPSETLGCRGADADQPDEFTRQRDKIISAIAAIDADVVGLIEIENNITDGPTADLVAGLNAAVGAGTYDYVATGAIGTDAIRTAFIYKPASVTPSGDFAVLDSSVNSLFDDSRNRPVLAQTFVENATGSAFTVAVNHFKSKGSSCGSGDDSTDGSGNCNVTRTNAATALVNWLATDPTGSGDADFLVIGDLNSYDKEDPIDVLTGAGYSDLVFDYLGEDAYSYVFDGQIGYLDYQLANAPLASQVTGATIWHINADEADLLDYDTSFKQAAQDAIYAPDAYRSSDHDPVLIGLELDTPMSLKLDTIDDLSALLPTGDSQDDFFIQKAIDRVGESINPAWWIDLATLQPKTGNSVFDREHQAMQELQKVNTVDVQSAIDQILEADRLLAQKQLDAAISGGGDAAAIAKAQGNIADAAANAASGNYAKAVLDYKKAWQNAVKAL